MKQHTNHTPGPLTCLCLVQTFPEAFWGHDQCCISPVLCAEVTNHGSHSMDEFINNLDGFINYLSSGNDARIWSQPFFKIFHAMCFLGSRFFTPSVFWRPLSALPRLEVQNDELWPSEYIEKKQHSKYLGFEEASQLRITVPLSVQTQMIVWENNLENWHFASSRKKSSRIQCWHFNEKLTAGVSKTRGDVCAMFTVHIQVFLGFVPCF